jgi:hypothetical protein
VGGSLLWGVVLPLRGGFPRFADLKGGGGVAVTFFAGDGLPSFPPLGAGEGEGFGGGFPRFADLKGGGRFALTFFAGGGLPSFLPLGEGDGEDFDSMLIPTMAGFIVSNTACIRAICPGVKCVII